MQEVLDGLRAGNERFCGGRPLGPRRDPARRRACASGQAPHAAVLSCSDSRAVPELVFDQGLGDLFVVRTAGHVADRAAIGSLEYAVGHLRVPVVVVLGHSRCGAVTAAVERAAGPANEAWVVQEIRPAAVAMTMVSGDPVSNAAHEHVRRTVAGLTAASAFLRDAVARGALTIVGAFYDLETGRVEFD